MKNVLFLLAISLLLALDKLKKYQMLYYIPQDNLTGTQIQSYGWSFYALQ
jgi:hypothetical protein